MMPQAERNQSQCSLGEDQQPAAITLVGERAEPWSEQQAGKNATTTQLVLEATDSGSLRGGSCKRFP
jgi:hypothetical protein